MVCKGTKEIFSNSKNHIYIYNGSGPSMLALYFLVKAGLGTANVTFMKVSDDVASSVP